MNSIVLFPDIEGLLVAYLHGALLQRGSDLLVSTEVPRTPPDGRVEDYIRLELIASTRRSLTIDEPVFIIETASSTKARALELASLVRGLVPAMADVPRTPIYGTDEVARPFWFPDLLSGTPRYSQTHAIRIRGYAA